MMFAAFLRGFPLPRLLAEKDRQIVERDKRIEKLEKQMEEERAYHRLLLDSILLKNSVRPVTTPEPEPPKIESNAPVDYSEWAEQDEAAEIEMLAQEAASNPVVMEYYREAAGYDEKFLPVVERAMQLRGR